MPLPMHVVAARSSDDGAGADDNDDAEANGEENVMVCLEETTTRMRSARSTRQTHDVSARLQSRTGVHFNTPLPPTNGFAHPACVLLRQRALLCANVCTDRQYSVAEACMDVERLGVPAYVENADLDDSGDVGNYEMQQILERHSEALLGRTASGSELQLLMCFVQLKGDRMVGSEAEAAEQLEFVLILWRIYERFGIDWTEQLKDARGPRDVLKLLRSVNGGKTVTESEARWVIEKVESMECTSADEETLALVFCVAYWYMSVSEDSNVGLPRDLLIERLGLELVFVRGLRLLVTLAIMFVLLLLAMKGVASTDNCRGIKSLFEIQFQLGSLAGIATLADLKVFIKDFSEHTGKLSPLSHQYFDRASWVLQDTPHAFNGPKILPPLDMDFTSSMTFQAWVGLDASAKLPHIGVPILRKAVGAQDSSGSLSCWSFNFPPSIAFGAHDYGGAAPSASTGLAEEYVAANYSVPVVNSVPQFSEHTRLVLHTLALNSTHATFMAAVRYFPRMLSSLDVFGIYRGGATMSSIGYAMRAKEAPAVEPADELKRSFEASVVEGKRRADLASAETSRTAALTAQAVNNPVDAPKPLRTSNHTITKVSDPVLGYAAWQLYDAPVFTDSTSKNLAPGNALPPAGSRGITISTWLKFDSSIGHGFHVARAAPLFDKSWTQYWDGWSNFCWMLYAGSGTAIYTKTGQVNSKGDDGPWLQLRDTEAPSEWQFKGKSFRHFVYQIDPGHSTKPLRICIDGVCSGHPMIDNYLTLFNLEKAPPSADCMQNGLIKSYPPKYQEEALNASRIYLNRRPVDDWPMTTWQMGTKYFDRILSSDEIKKLFDEDPDPEDKERRSIRQARGCAYSSEQQDDRTFRDGFGRNCMWYFDNYVSDPMVCQRSPSALEACPVACRAKEACWGSGFESSKSKEMQIWPMQMEFRSRGRWGTTCVGKSTTPEREAVKCALNAPNWPKQCKAAGLTSCGPKDCRQHENDRTALLDCLGDTTWLPESGNRWDTFLPCRDIITLHEETCDWDDSLLDEVANAANSTGAWSINFWVEALADMGCLQPQVRLLGGDGGTFAFLGGANRLVADTAAKVSCAKEDWYTYAVVGKRSDGHALLPLADLVATEAAAGTKHFVVFGRRADGWAGLYYNEHSTFENIWSGTDGPGHIPTDRNFLRVINVIGNVRMTPWRLRSDFPESGELAAMRYAQTHLQAVKRGPVQPLAEQMRTRLVRTAKSFSQKTMVLAPPLLMQSRIAASGCKTSPLALRVAEMVRDRGSQHQCVSPFVCPDYTTDAVYQCSGEDMFDGDFFGSPPMANAGTNWYVEYLSSISDHSVLVRPVKNETSGTIIETMLRTDDFLDTLTDELKLPVIFYSMDFGILSTLMIQVQVSGGRIRATYDLRHNVAVVGASLTSLITLLAAASVLCLVYLYFVGRVVLTVWKHERRVDYFRIPDIAFPIVLFGVIVVRLVESSRSSGIIESLVSMLMSLDWADISEMPNELLGVRDRYAENKLRYFNIVKEVMGAAQYTYILDSAMLVIFLMLLARIVVATDCHPRIALIAKTLKAALSDLFHFGLLFAIVFIGFALIGSWRFGAVREDFKDFFEAFSTQFDAMLGPPGALNISGLAEDQWEFLIYAFCFQCICFFFVLNFILAIIIDAYSSVMDEVRNSNVEMDILSDLFAVTRSGWKRFRYKWPDTYDIIFHLKHSIRTTRVTGEQLWWDGDLFPELADAQAFVEYYGGFDFLSEVDPEPLEPSVADLASFQCLTLQKVEQSLRIMRGATHTKSM
eukprot:TRINITY_DN7397_c0_g1_i1.p1 TRINITY_DN7397_c0_g1~~TRINITY_DN7397_c0_g1_i1.p1  ORF type:complete len:1776 (+),score=320.55 TRINITY_DN7397_c0_g1_i1:104-5431(+)